MDGVAATEPRARRILITGASGAIGMALVEAYAGPGVVLWLQGRDADRLEMAARVAADRGAEVSACRIELRDFAAIRAWLEPLEAFDLVLVNAGMNAAAEPGLGTEGWETAEAVIDVNLKAAVAVTEAVLPAMQRQGCGQVALIGSLAGWFGLPMNPAYSATKAGLRVYGEALRGALGSRGIRVNVVLPGYIRSPMGAAMPGPKPFVTTAGEAARVIRRGLERDRARISFPWPLALGTRLLAMLPPGLAIRILHWLGYGLPGGAATDGDASVRDRTLKEGLAQGGRGATAESVTEGPGRGR